MINSKTDPDLNQINQKIYKVLTSFISFWFSYISQTKEKINFKPLRLLLLIAIGVFHVDTDFEWFNRFKSSMLIPARALEVTSNDEHYPRPDASGESLLRVWHYLDIYSIQLISSIISPRRWIHIFFHISIQDAPNDAHNNRFVETILKSPPQPLN